MAGTTIYSNTSYWNTTGGTSANFQTVRTLPSHTDTHTLSICTDRNQCVSTVTFTDTPFPIGWCNPSEVLFSVAQQHGKHSLLIRWPFCVAVSVFSTVLLQLYFISVIAEVTAGVSAGYIHTLLDMAAPRSNRSDWSVLLQDMKTHMRCRENTNRTTLKGDPALRSSWHVTTAESS